MKFINKGNDVKVRIDEKNGYRWVTVHTGDTINLLPRIGFANGFVKAPGVISKIKNAIPKVTTGKIGNTKVETKQISETSIIDDSGYRAKLIAVNGIGKKTADDIIKVYPSEGQLKVAVAKDLPFPFRDDIEKILKKEFIEKIEPSKDVGLKNAAR